VSEELHNFDDDPVGRPRLRPAVAFGLRAATLAGLVVSVGLAEAAASGLFDGPDAVASTCCIETK
jgi:hypothetical protein